MLLISTTAAPLITDPKIVIGILFACLGIVFATSNSENPTFKKFYKIVPALFMCYFLPAILVTCGLVASKWNLFDEFGEVILKENGDPKEVKLGLYHVATRYLLPAALVLMTLSINLRDVFRLGYKALVMFFTGTIGIVIGGPIAILLIGSIFSGSVDAEGADATWKGLSTLAGSWIGGGANQTGMIEIAKFDKSFFSAYVVVDIVVANIWMAFLLYGVGKKKKIDKWLKADDSAITDLQNRVEQFSKGVTRVPSLTDYIKIAAVGFFIVSASHLFGGWISGFFEGWLGEESTLASSFLWLIVLSTLFGIVASFTNLRKLEGAGAMKIGSVFIYILVATLGMHMDLRKIVDNPYLILIGLVWMAIHVGLMFGMAKLIKAPYFFLAVGSKANVGGAASAPVVAAAFNPALAPVGVLLAVVGYAVGTVGAIACMHLMEMAANFVI